MLRQFATAFLLIFMAEAVMAQEPVEKLTINGYTVYLVNLKKGNQFGYTFSVPYGSADDEPAQFGRAHFFEHMFARGSRRYPGHETLIKAMTGFGYERNAATGLSATFYYASGNEAHGLEALSMHLASLEAPELEPSSFIREKATVVNEIISSAPNRPIRALFSLPFMVLTDPTHPAHGQFTGTHATLDPMSPDDLRALHQNIYHAGNVRLAVFANLTNGQLTRDQIVQKLETILPKSDRPKASYVPAAQPPLFSHDQILDIVTPNDRVGMILLPLAPGSDVNAVSAYLRVFTNSFRNGLQDLARRQLGWTDDIDAEVYRVGPHQVVALDFRMTDAGYEHREQLVQWILESLQSGQHEAFPAEVLEHHRASVLINYKQVEDDLERLLGLFPNWMTDFRAENKLRFDWDAEASLFNNETLRAGANAIRYTGKTVTFMGPDGSRANHSNTFYGLKYGIKDWLSTPSGLPTYSPRAVQMPQIKLPATSQEGEALTKNEWSQHPGWTFMSTHEADWVDRTVKVQLQFGKLSPLDQLSLNAWVYGANQDLRPELAALSARGLSVGVSAGDGGLVLTAQGRDGQEIVALTWLIQQLVPYVPSESMIQHYRENTTLSLQRAEEGFPAQVAIGVVRDLISARGNGALSLRQATGQLGGESIRNFLSTSLMQSYKTVTLAGTYREAELNQLIHSIESLSPKFWPTPPLYNFELYRVQANDSYEEGWQKEGQAGVGRIRLFSGPPVKYTRDLAALNVITELLREQVFLRNRPLGYMQGAAQIAPTFNNKHILFYGQTNSPAELAQMESVWDDELNKWRNRQIDDAAIEKARQGVLAELNKASSKSAEGAGEVQHGLSGYGDPFYKQKLVSAVMALSHDDIFAVANTYLGAESPYLTVTKGGPTPACGDLLERRMGFRSGLLSPAPPSPE